MNDGPVCFGNCNPGHISSGLWDSFTQLLLHDIDHQRYLGGFAVIKAGGLLSIYRNRVALAFLETRCDWLWFVDSDIVLEVDTLDRLMEHSERPIIGALYFMGLDTGVVPSILKRRKEPDGTVRIGPIFTPQDYPQNQVLTVDAVGMGCTLIHRDVLEKMKDHYGMPEPCFTQAMDGTVLCGEDVSFCMRAAELGFPSAIHTGIEVGHEKTVVLRSEGLR